MKAIIKVASVGMAMGFFIGLFVANEYLIPDIPEDVASIEEIVKTGHLEFNGTIYLVAPIKATSAQINSVITPDKDGCIRVIPGETVDGEKFPDTCVESGSF